MTAIFVSPDTEYIKEWEPIAFRTAWDAPDEEVRKAGSAALRDKWPYIQRINSDWELDLSQKPRIGPHPFPGDPEKNLTRQTLGLPPMSYIDRILEDGLKDWVIWVYVQRKKRVTLKFQAPLGPAEGFALREDAPPDLQEGIGSETPAQRVING